MTETIQNRVVGIFEKLHSISSSVQEEKNSRFQVISQLIQVFEINLRNITEQKEEKFQGLANKLRVLQDVLENESEGRIRQEQETLKLLTDLERHAKRVLEANTKERSEQEKKIAYSINQQIDLLSQEVAKESLAQQDAHKYIDAYLNEDLPKIADELQNEIQERKEVEEKIYHQFIEQISDLRELFERYWR